MAKNSGIKLNLKGFDRLLEQLQAAGKDADRAAAETIKESARVVSDVLHEEAQAHGVPDDITSKIRTETANSRSNVYSAQVGWKMGNYDPRNPSAGYKAVFLNYGTVRRQTKAGKNRGAIRKRPQAQQFIYAAKKKARSRVNRLHKEMLRRALEGIGK